MRERGRNDSFILLSMQEYNIMFSDNKPHTSLRLI